MNSTNREGIPLSMNDFATVKPLKGYIFLGEHEITCMNCDKPLFTLVKISNKPTIMKTGMTQVIAVQQLRFQSNCPFCGEKSWLAEIEGQAMLGAVNDSLIMTDVISHDPIQDVALTEIKLEIKNG